MIWLRTWLVLLFLTVTMLIVCLGKVDPRSRLDAGTGPRAGTKHSSPATRAQLAQSQDVGPITQRDFVEPMPLVEGQPPRSPEQERLLREASTLVARVRSVPDVRIQFLDTLYHQLGMEPASKGWNLSVQNVEPHAEWPRITLWVSAQTGGGFFLGNVLVEEYDESRGIFVF